MEGIQKSKEGQSRENR